MLPVWTGGGRCLISSHPLRYQFQRVPRVWILRRAEQRGGGKYEIRFSFAGQNRIVFREINLCKEFVALGEYFCTGTGQKYARQIASRSLLPQHLWVTAAAERISLKPVKSFVFAHIDISSQAGIRVDLAGDLGTAFPRGWSPPLRCWLN